MEKARFQEYIDITDESIGYAFTLYSHRYLVVLVGKREVYKAPTLYSMAKVLLL
jgi:hypothetical protein